MKKKFICLLLGVSLALSLVLPASAQEISLSDDTLLTSAEQVLQLVAETEQKYGVEIADEDASIADIEASLIREPKTAGQFRREMNYVFGEPMQNRDQYLADNVVNTIEEFLPIVSEIEQETNTSYHLNVTIPCDLIAKLYELNASPTEIKERLYDELKHPEKYPDGLVTLAKMESTTQIIPASVREDLHQTSNAYLSGGGQSLLATAYLDSSVFSVTGTPGTFTYQQIKGHGLVPGQNFSNVSSRANVTNSRKTASVLISATALISGIPLVSVSGQFGFSAG